MRFHESLASTRLKSNVPYLVVSTGLLKRIPDPGFWDRLPPLAVQRPVPHSISGLQFETRRS